MNNEQANTNASTVDVEEEKHPTEGAVEVNQEVASETETSEVAEAASATNADAEEHEEATDTEGQVTASDAAVEEAATLADETAPEAAIEVADSEAEAAVVTPDETVPAEGLEGVAADAEEIPSEAAAPEEPAESMSPESLEEAYDNSIKAFTDGEIVKGIVVDVNRDEVMIDIGFKSEGYIQASEFDAGQDGLPTVQVGDEIDVYIVRREDSEGQIVLSKKIADQTLIWDEIATAYEAGTPVMGRIIERIKGGLRVSVGSLRGFLPASQVELRPIQNLEQYVGQTLEMKVISLSKRRHNIVLSRRAWLEAELVQKRSEVPQHT